MWVLTDNEADIWHKEFQLLPADLGLNSNWSIHKRVIKGGPSDGVDIIEVDNGALSFSIIPSRGMGIWKGQYRGLDIGWNSPVSDLCTQVMSIYKIVEVLLVIGFWMRLLFDAVWILPEHSGPDIVPNNMYTN